MGERLAGRRAAPMTRALVCAALAAILMLAPGCGRRAVTYTRYTANYFDVFDTVTTLVGYAPDQATFDRVAGAAHAELRRLHRLYDIYNEYDGLNNARTLNLRAAQGPVAVDGDLMALLVYARDMQRQYPGKGNIALGAVLKIW
ncbi:MAG: FAD:protein FMN transferase, partial [Clostridiales bacterium]|nr:FAD:protein FMN transferase [Clostridiales bacterium]